MDKKQFITAMEKLMDINFDEGYCPFCGNKVGNSLPNNDKFHRSDCSFILARKVLIGDK